MERVGRVMVAARIAGGPRILATGALWHAPSGAASAPTAGPKAIAHIRAAAGRQVSRGWLEGAAVSPVQRPAESATAAPQAWRLIQSRHRSHGRAGSARGAHDQAMMEFAKQNEQQLTLTELINFGKNADRSSPILCNLTLKELPVRLSKRVQELQRLSLWVFCPTSVFYTGRIGIRVLIDQHLTLRADSQEYAGMKTGVPHKRGDEPLHTSVGSRAFIGCIERQCKLEEVIMDAVADAKSACRMHLQDSAPVEIVGMTDLTVPYIPEHLYIAVFELLKNSQRATVPPTPDCWRGGGTDCHVRISDRGGGIPPESVPRIWNFAFSTAPRGIGELAGFGHGLGLSRLYARYWGGDIQVQNLENHGVDCYIRLGVPANVPPDFVHASVQ
ncbi:histidine kinase-like ATPase, partial [Baffinella frigidus]